MLFLEVAFVLFQDTLVILTVAMTTPWGILEQLQHWTSVLADHVDKLDIDVDLRQAKRQHLVKIWIEYVEPGDELDPASPMKRSSRNLGEDNDFDVASLPEGNYNIKKYTFTYLYTLLWRQKTI